MSALMGTCSVELPVASAEVLGGVMVQEGSGLAVDEEGNLSVVPASGGSNVTKVITVDNSAIGGPTPPTAAANIQVTLDTSASLFVIVPLAPERFLPVNFVFPPNVDDGHTFSLIATNAFGGTSVFSTADGSEINSQFANFLSGQFRFVQSMNTWHSLP